MERNDALPGRPNRADEQSQEILIEMAQVIGQKWHPVILHQLLEQAPLRFSNLSEQVGPITNKVLSQSLSDLQEKGLVERTVVNEKPVAVEYSLTECGRSIEPVITAMQEWGETHLGDVQAADNCEADGRTSA